MRPLRRSGSGRTGLPRLGHQREVPQGTVVDLNRYFTVASPGIRYTPASVAVGTRPLGVTIAKRVTEAGGAGRTLTTTIWTAIDVA